MLQQPSSQVGSRRQDRPAFGLLLFLCSLLLMTIIGGLVKDLSDRYPVQQILFFRFVFTFLPFAALVWLSSEESPFRTKHPGVHVLRSVSGIAAIGMMFYALSTIPLADATALVYAAPMFVTLMAVPALGEKIGFRRLVSVVLGFVGMMIIVQPGEMSVGLGVVAGVGSAFFSAIVTIALRRLGATEPTLRIGVIYNGMGTAVWFTSCLVFGWFMPSALDLGLLVLLGLIAAVQQYLITASFKYGEANLLAAFEYMALVLAAIVGYVIWNEVPGINTVLGASIIVGSGLFVIYRETALKRRSRQPVTRSETTPGS